jgi:hypothetical protein
MSGVQHFMRQLGHEIQSIIDGALELSWYSRGAWQYRDVLTMSAGEKDRALNFINKRMDAISKHTHPVY